MMSAQMQNISIGPFQTGLQTDVDSFIAPIDSFSELDNFHIKHGKIQKRSGFRELGQIKETDTPVNISGITQADPGEVTTAAHGLTTGDKIYIAGITGMTELNDTIVTVTVTAPTTFTIGVDTSGYGAYSANGTIAKIIDASDTVMGIDRYLNEDGSYTTLAFSTKRANKYDTISGDFSPLDSADIMSGSDTDFIWTASWQVSNLTNRIYFTNGKIYDGSSLDGIRYFDSSGTGNTTTGLRPSLGGSNVLYGGRLLFVLKGRLVVLYTYEYDGANTATYPQRARWCKFDSPSTWDETVAGGGGYVDAPTGDMVISARALKDRIIVFMTNSVWSLRTNSNPALPFIWEKINNFRACDGKMASVGYDQYVIGMGIRGITATDGRSTQRIDERISDFVTSDINSDDFGKVYMARSYLNQRMIALYPSIESDTSDKALVFDDDSKAFSKYTIPMNCMGYGSFSVDYGYDDFTAENDLDVSYEELGDETYEDFNWQEGLDAFLGGNTTGTVYYLEQDGDDNGTEIKGELFTAGINPFKDQGVDSLLSYVDLLLDVDYSTKFDISFYKDDQNPEYKIVQNMNCLPHIGLITNINNAQKTSPCQITAPTHGLSTGDTCWIYGVQGMTALNGEQFTVTRVDDNNLTLDGIDATGYDTYTNGGAIFKNQIIQLKTWKRIYAGGIGFQHRIKIKTTGLDKPFNLHRMVLGMRPRGRRFT